MKLKSIIKDSSRLLRKGLLVLAVPAVMSGGCAPNSYYLEEDFKREMTASNLSSTCRKDNPYIEVRGKEADSEALYLIQRIDTCEVDSLMVLTEAEGLELEAIKTVTDGTVTKKTYKLEGKLKNWKYGEGSFPIVYKEGEEDGPEEGGVAKDRTGARSPERKETQIKYETKKVDPKQIVNVRGVYAFQGFCCSPSGWRWRNNASFNLKANPFKNTRMIGFEAEGEFYNLGYNNFFYRAGGSLDIEAVRKHRREVDLGLKLGGGYANFLPLGNGYLKGEIYGDEMGEGNLSDFARIFDDFEYRFGIENWLGYKGISFNVDIEFLLEITKNIGGLSLGVEGHVPLGSFNLSRNYIDKHYPGTPNGQVFNSENSPFGVRIEAGPKARVEVGDFNIDFKVLYFNYLSESLREKIRAGGTEGMMMEVKGEY